MCCKHEVSLGCLCLTRFQANLKHLKYRLLQMHMEDIWHSCYCDPKLWTFSLSIIFSVTFLVLTYNVNAMFLYNKSSSDIEISYFSSSWPRKNMTFAFFVVPIYDVVIVPYASLLDYLSLNLIVWHILFSKKLKSQK